MYYLYLYIYERERDIGRVSRAEIFNLFFFLIMDSEFCIIPGKVFHIPKLLKDFFMVSSSTFMFSFFILTSLIHLV